MSDDSIFDTGLGHDSELPDFVQEPSEAPGAPEPEAPVPTTEELYPNRPEASESPQQPSERPRDEKGRFIKGEAPETPEVPETEQKSLDQQTEAEQKAWAGKYQSPEQLEKGYRELRDLQRRTAERAKAYEQRVAEVEFQARQMEQAVGRATEYVRSLQQQQMPQQPQQVLYDEMGNPIQIPYQQPGLTPDQIQPMVEQQVEQRLALQAQAQQQQMWQREKYLEAQAAQARFFEAHPEVEKDGDVDNDIASTILALNEAWSPMDGSTFNIGSEESLEVAYEAAQRPALRTVLEKNPAFIDDDAGMVLARALASQIEAATQGTPQATRMVARPNTPVVERGSSPAPQQASPLDEFDQAVAEYRNQNKVRGSKVFFGE